MDLTGSILQTILVICALLVAASAVAVVLLIARIRRDLGAALRPTESDRISRLEAQTRANDRLFESRQGRTALVEFFVSEANISAFFREAENEIARAESETQAKAALERMKTEERKKWGFNLDSLKRGAKAIGEKLFDKANDLIKPYLGGGGGGGAD